MPGWNVFALPVLVKPQLVRLIDVLILDPFMMYASVRKNLTKTERLFLTGVGFAAIIYNWRNYAEGEKRGDG